MLTPLDPLGMFCKLSAIPGVTFNEYLIYGRLLEFWQQLAESLPPEKKKHLTIGFTPSGQLKVRWTGNRDSKRRLIVVAHVDKEGFVIEQCSPDMTSYVGWHTAVAPFKEDNEGKEAILLR